MKKIRCVIAYILGLLGWFVGVVIGIIWALLYGGYQETNIIDLPTLLMENITPALVSVFLGNYLFTKFFPDCNYKTTNIIIFYVILFLNYGYILSDSIFNKNYSNIIYVATGVISLIYLLTKLYKTNKNEDIKRGS